MTGRCRDEAAALAGLEALHGRVDARARVLEARHRGRLACRRGCAGCCVDGITVHSVEAERIRRAAAELLARGVPRAAGACAFLDRVGCCRVYGARPYVCRTQGLPLRWAEPSGDGRASVERRDICPLNEAGEPVTSLDPGECWTIGPVEGELAALEQMFTGGRPKRVALRAMFARGTHP